jgi:hypothetical protein
MSKITVEHLQRIACVYVRQSTPDQLVHNLESQRRQYGLADRVLSQICVRTRRATAGLSRLTPREPARPASSHHNPGGPLG